MEQKEYRLLLVYPSVHRGGVERINPFWLPPLGLATVAGCTPDNWETRLVDENVEDIDFDEECDLVAIGFMTANCKRAYFIAEEFRNRGRKVILGGAHVTVVPEEAATSGDAIVIGDAESVWSAVIDDFSRNKLKKVYYAQPNATNINTFSYPRRDLYKKGAYLSVNSVQTTRGCPYNCSFCSIASRYERRYGKKDLVMLEKELAALENPEMPVFFVDDNLLVDKERSKKLLQLFKKYKIRWWSQADICIGQDEKMLELIKESGCIKLVVGFESLSAENINKIGKTQNKVGDYADFISKMHRHGILVNTSFSFGGDDDREDVFETTLKFLVEHQVIFATFNILTPLPGTQLFAQMTKEGRIIDWDWSHYDMGHPVFQPKHMSPQALKEGYDWICQEFYGLPRIHNRVSAIKEQKERFDINLILMWSLGYKKMLDAFGVFM